MSWTPIFQIDQGNTSESEQLKELSEVEYRNKVLSSFSEISLQLRLLNARIEEAFATHLEEMDV